MKKIYPLTVACFFLCMMLCLAPVLLKGQQMPGLSNSNYAGIHGVLVNPSQAADTRYNFYLTVGGVNYTVNSSYLKKIGSDPIGYPFLAAPAEGLYSRSLQSGAVSPTGQLSISSEILGPSVVIKLGQNTGFAVFTRYRGFINGKNIPPFFGDFYSGETGTTEAESLQADPLLMNTSSFSEIGLSVGQTLFQHKNHYVKGGATYKRLIGTYASFLELQNPTYNISRQQGNAHLHLSANSYQLGYSSLEPAPFSFGKLFSPAENPGSGHGFDVGLTYEFRPKIEQYEYFMDGKTRLDNEKNKYRLRVNMALLDIGSIHYQTDSVQTISGTPEPLELTADSFREIGESPVRELHRLVSPNSEMEEQEGFSMNLPSRFNLQLDYHVGKNFYMNLMMERNLKPFEKNNIQIPSLVALTPRLESDGMELAFPVSFIEGQEKVAVGTGIKIGFIEIGVSNALALFGSDNSRSSNIYLGLRFFNVGKKRKDSDNDGVSDRHDVCPEVQGIWEFLGCPDSDLDGVEDKFDECPEMAGQAAFNGCPDTDGDGIRDKSDLCPYEKGLLLFNGCPDTDGDEVPDYEDDCPALAGLAGYYGCPDTDGDQVPDSEDACARTPGLAEFAGCPDTDADGVPDTEDECPATIGSFKLNGCPDSDGDGVADPKDSCPAEAGTALANGCPDNDLDGVADKEDQCPETAGDLYNKGCPVFSSGHEEVRISAEARETIQQAEAILAFDEHLQLTPASGDALLRVVEIVEKYPESRVLIMYFDYFGGEEAAATDEWSSNNGWDTSTPAAEQDHSSEEKANTLRQFFLDQGLFMDQVTVEQKWANDIPEKVEFNQNSMIMLRIIK